MKVGDLEVGRLYKISGDGRIGHRVGATPWPPMDNSEPWIYLGPKMVYGGKNGDQVVTERVHHFVRPNGKRIYIYGEHIKHIRPFTRD